MSLGPGDRLGPYEIQSAIGAGGMGEVYRARDTRLRRAVAIKVLPEAVANNTELLARFEREASTLALLNHPNIGQIYGLEESEGRRALVMELVEGPTLADRIAQGPIPVDEALSIAKQIAEALEAAHAQGIIHRDLKPANIKVRPDGTVKVLDFGLAKTLDSSNQQNVPWATEHPPHGLSVAPTVISRALTTGVGVLLGTAPYMSPEQAQGKPVDKRADIWAFGCVLYEMLTGNRAFVGEHLTEVLAAVLRAEPDWNSLPRTPLAIRRLLLRCLHKNCRDRLHDIADARLDLVDAQAALSQPTAAQDATRGGWGWRRAIPYAAAAFLVTVTVGATVLLSRPAASVRSVRFSVEPPDGWLVPVSSPEVRGANTADPALAVSPDGQRIAFVASREGRNLIWIRAMDSLSAEPLTGTEGASSPFWSPDGMHLAFFADGALKRIDATGGAPVRLCDADNPRGGTWSSNNVIVFGNAGSPLQRVSASGGIPAAVTTLAKGDMGHNRPHFLPDGRHFLYREVRGSRPGERVRGATFVGSLDSSDTVMVLESDGSNVQYAQGRLLFLRGTTLMAQPFDAERLAVTGEPVPVAEEIVISGGPPIGQFSASAGGVLAFRSDSVTTSRSKLVWFDRSGKELAAVDGHEGWNTSLDVSPDGLRVAAALRDPVTGASDIWLLDNGRGTRSRLTSDPAEDGSPAWSRDGTLIFFDSARNGRSQLFVTSVDGGRPEQALLDADVSRSSATVSPDGQYVVFVQDRGENSDLFATRVTGQARTVPFMETPFAELDPRFSPDGRWVAYTSNESGRPEVYAATFPGGAGKRQISSGGGAGPRWRQDATEIFFSAPDTGLMSASVDSRGSTLEVRKVERLFSLPWIRREAIYAVSPDGSRILAQVSSSETPITIVVNWFEEMRRLVPTN